VGGSGKKPPFSQVVRRKKPSRKMISREVGHWGSRERSRNSFPPREEIKLGMPRAISTVFARAHGAYGPGGFGEGYGRESSSGRVGKIFCPSFDMNANFHHFESVTDGREECVHFVTRRNVLYSRRPVNQINLRFFFRSKPANKMIQGSLKRS